MRLAPLVVTENRQVAALERIADALEWFKARAEKAGSITNQAIPPGWMRP